MEQAKLQSEGWRFESPDVLRLLAKLKDAGKPLGEFVNGKIYRGVITGLNEALILDRLTRDRLIDEHSSSSELLKPFLRGKDVKRWQFDFNDRYLFSFGQILTGK
jgi:hypothetical protein